MHIVRHVVVGVKNSKPNADNSSLSWQEMFKTLFLGIKRCSTKFKD